MGSTDDEQGAPDSWELADVEDSMRRLLSKKSASTSQIQGEESKSSLVSSNSLNSEGEDQRINQVDQFLREAIQNPRERLSVLRMEQDVEKFLHNPRQQELEFSQLPTSYLRLAAHRLAQHYCMQSSVAVDNSSLDVTANKIIIRKTLQTRAPPIRLADIPVSLPQDEKHNMVKVAIKQRPQKGSHHNSGYGSDSKNSNQAKSVEERKEEYNRARARIFSLSHNSQAGSKPIEESTSFENLHTRDNLRSEENSCMDEPRNYSKTTSDGSSGSARPSKVKVERDNNKPKNKVAIFRDRDSERKDPDYDRSYERYTQRFDPGFGFNVGPYSMQALYAPPVNYNTEFPQLGAPQQHRAQIPMEAPQHHQVAQHVRGPWINSASSMGYNPLDAVMGPFNPTHMGAPSGSALYMHSQQFTCPGQTMTFVRPQDRIQQTLIHPSLQQQPEACYNQARPR